MGRNMGNISETALSRIFSIRFCGLTLRHTGLARRREFASQVRGKLAKKIALDRFRAAAFLRAAWSRWTSDAPPLLLIKERVRKRESKRE